MKFAILREKLLTPLQQVVGVVERRQTLAILSNVLMKLSGESLEITGTDLEIQLVTRVDVESAGGSAVTVPARKLLDICRTLPEGSVVKVDCQQERFSIQCGRSRFSLNTLPASNYPAFDTNAADFQLTISSALLKRAMEKTLFAMAQQDVRYYLNGLLVDVRGGRLRTVASDGHRLALYEETLEDEERQSRQIILPRKGVQELYRLLGDEDLPVHSHVAANNIRLEFGDVTFSAKLIEGRYPDFQKGIPTEITRIISVDKLSLKSALTRVAILSNEKSRGVNIDIRDGMMVIESHNAEQEEAREELAVDLQGEGIAVGFNAGYLLDVLNNIESETVRISFNAKANSALLEDPGDSRVKFIVMPLKL